MPPGIINLFMKIDYNDNKANLMQTNYYDFNIMSFFYYLHYVFGCWFLYLHYMFVGWFLIFFGF